MESPAISRPILELSFTVPRTVHFVGIGGSGMQALASVLADSGWRVSGSDLQINSAALLAGRGIQLFSGHAARNVPPDASVLVASAAVPEGNPEMQRAKQLGIPVRRYAEMLGELTGNYRTLAIAGTHGKSTVTAMLSEILVRAGIDPTVICGAATAKNRNVSSSLQGPAAQGRSVSTGGRRGNSRVAVVEACEYGASFLQLRPSLAVVLNMEHDHFDCYPTPAHLMNAFEQFIQCVPQDGLVIASDECYELGEFARSSERHVVTFGFSIEANWRATNLEHSRGRYRFDVLRQGRRLTRVVLAVPGRHQVLNSLAAAAVARHCGVSIQHIAHGLASFRGLSRRLELRGRWLEVPWVDDYAHHPTEVKASLETVRQMFPRRRLCCVFQPHQAVRLTALLDEFASVLHNADTVAVADVFRAREGAPQPGEATSHDLAKCLRATGCEVLDEYQPVEIARRLAVELKPGNVLVTMGAGDLGKHFGEFHKRLRRNRAVA